MIRDKISAELKDFAFVEYFTVEEATYAMNQIKKNPIKIKNQIIYCTFSKIRRPEDFKVIKTYLFKYYFKRNSSFVTYLKKNFLGLCGSIQ